MWWSLPKEYPATLPFVSPPFQPLFVNFWRDFLLLAMPLWCYVFSARWWWPSQCTCMYFVSSRLEQLVEIIFLTLSWFINSELYKMWLVNYEQSRCPIIKAPHLFFLIFLPNLVTANSHPLDSSYLHMRATNFLWGFLWANHFFFFLNCLLMGFLPPHAWAQTPMIGVPVTGRKYATLPPWKHRPVVYGIIGIQIGNLQMIGRMLSVVTLVSTTILFSLEFCWLLYYTWRV